MPKICLRPAILRLVTTAILVAVVLTSFSAEAELHSRLGGQAYYDDLLDITWATDTNHISFGTWGTRLSGMSTLIIGGVPGWRLPDMDVNNDGTIEACSFVISQADCMDNEMGHINWYGDGTGGISSGAPGPFTNMGPFDYWSNTVAPGVDEAYHLNMSNGSFGPASTENIFGGWAVHDGDVIPEAIVDVSYVDPVINSGPLSFGLSALPANPTVAIEVGAGTPAGGGSTSYDLGDVLSANFIFGDVIGPNSVTAFSMQVLANGAIDSLSFTFSPFDTPSVTDGIIIMNSPLSVTGTDVASGNAFSYTYADSVEVFTSSSAPSVPGLSMLGLACLSLVVTSLGGWMLMRRRDSASRA